MDKLHILIQFGIYDRHNCFLKGKFWRIVTKSGGEKAPAIIAVAHTLLLLVYQVLQTNKPFEDRTAPPIDERQKQRLICHHIRRLGKWSARQSLQETH